MDEIFNSVDKNRSTDAVSQILVGLDRLHFQEPLLGATLPHFSESTRQIGSHRLKRTVLAADLLPLPDNWEADLKQLFERA